MANKRMFSNLVIDTDAFLDMPLSAQALYFHLNMKADDDGFVANAKRIQRTIGASEDDLKLLIMKRFLLSFDDGVLVIKHWKMHNVIRKDTYVPTAYQEDFAMLTEKPNKSYTLQVCNESVTDTLRECTTDKIRIDKNREDIILSKDNICQTDVRQVIEYWNSLSDLGIPPVTKISPSSQRYSKLKARIREYDISNVLKAIDNIRESKFLQGKTNANWIITFDWFVKPNNFPKVLEGNYNDSHDIPSDKVKDNDDIYSQLGDNYK